MFNRLVFLFIHLLVLSCGQHNSITSFTEQESLNKVFTQGFKETNNLKISGDGYLVQTIKIPLTGDTIDPYAYDPSNVNALFLSPLLENFKQVFYNLAVNAGLGKKKLTISMDVPSSGLDYLNSIKLTKAVFIMDNRKCDKEVMNAQIPCSESGDYKRERKVEGVKSAKRLNFKFIDKVILNLEGTNSLSNLGDEIGFSVEDVGLLEFNKLVKNKDRPENSPHIAGYRKLRNKHIRQSNTTSHLFYIKTKWAYDLKTYLKESVQYREQISAITKVPGFVFIETQDVKQIIKKIKKDPSIDQYEVQNIQECTQNKCLELAVLDYNIIPLIQKNNRLDINLLIDIFKVPRKAFWLKGFLEFEIKYQLPFKL